MQLIQVRRMRNGERVGYIDTKSMPAYLSQRQWKDVVNQVNSTLRAWQEQMTAAVKPMIASLPGLSDETRRALYRANLAHAWWDDDVLAPIVRTLMRATLPLPNFSRCSTMLLGTSVVVEDAAPDSPHALWARISRPPGQGTPILIPLGGNRYEASASGVRANFMQITLSSNGSVVFRVVKHRAAVPPRDSDRGYTLGVDWGLRTLAATSDGRLLGRKFYDWLAVRDRELTELDAALRRQGLRPRDSRRYRRLLSRIRGYVRNEVGRVINVLASDPDLTEIAVEDLDFRSPGLSRQMNRILSRAGRGAWASKLRSLPADTGIAVTHVNPAYTSRQCSGCGYVDARNRLQQNRFKCLFCGKILHADINASRMIRQRRSVASGGQMLSKSAVLAHLDQRFVHRWTADPGRMRERQLRPGSRAPRTSVRVNS